jgi:hypothetical protein
MRRNSPLAPVLALAALAGGCVHSPNGGYPPPDAAAIDRARREERIRIMQEAWNRQAAPNGRPAAGAPLLDYPAGSYLGIRFAPRTAADPSLAEPDR